MIGLKRFLFAAAQTAMVMLFAQGFPLRMGKPANGASYPGAPNMRPVTRRYLALLAVLGIMLFAGMSALALQASALPGSGVISIALILLILFTPPILRISIPSLFITNAPGFTIALARLVIVAKIITSPLALRINIRRISAAFGMIRSRTRLAIRLISVPITRALRVVHSWFGLLAAGASLVWYSLHVGLHNRQTAPRLLIAMRGLAASNYSISTV